jgi:hypothetical protein
MAVTPVANSTSVLINWNLASGSFSEIIINSQPDPVSARDVMGNRTLNLWNSISNANCSFSQTISGKVLNSPSATYNNQVKTLCSNNATFFATLNPDMCGCLAVTTPTCAASYPGMTVINNSAAPLPIVASWLILAALALSLF